MPYGRLTIEDAQRLLGELVWFHRGVHVRLVRVVAIERGEVLIVDSEGDRWFTEPETLSETLIV
jgi:hypothetical protein